MRGHGGKRKGSGRKKLEHSMPPVDYHAAYLRGNKDKEKTVTLICLKCGEEFESEDKCKHRLCKNCKELHVWRTGPDFTTHPLLRRNTARGDY